jgi:hypothetical protein
MRPPQSSNTQFSSGWGKSSNDKTNFNFLILDKVTGEKDFSQIVDKLLL